MDFIGTVAMVIITQRAADRYPYAMVQEFVHLMVDK